MVSIFVYLFFFSSQNLMKSIFTWNDFFPPLFSQMGLLKWMSFENKIIGEQKWREQNKKNRFAIGVWLEIKMKF